MKKKWVCGPRRCPCYDQALVCEWWSPALEMVIYRKLNFDGQIDNDSQLSIAQRIVKICRWGCKIHYTVLMILIKINMFTCSVFPEPHKRIAPVRPCWWVVAVATLDFGDDGYVSMLQSLPLAFGVSPGLSIHIASHTWITALGIGANVSPVPGLIDTVRSISEFREVWSLGHVATRVLPSTYQW